MDRISFIDLSRQQERIRENLEQRIAQVLKRGDYILGRDVEELEASLCAMTGARYCVTCASGSDGLLMAAMALEAHRGDPAFVPAFTFFATAEMPALAGMTPVFVDIDPVYFQMAPAALEKAVKENPCERGIVLPVDLFGQPAPYDEILSIAGKYGLSTIEDAAQAFGASYHGRQVCNLGCSLAVTSFFPAKPLGCYGDGGAVFTNDPGLASRLVSIRTHGKGQDKYDNIRLGINGRMDTIQAAILLAKLEIFEDEIKRRNHIARLYIEELKGARGLRLPQIMPDCSDVWAQFCILLDMGERDEIKLKLADAGIPTNIYYPTPLPGLKAFAHLGVPSDAYPVAWEVSQRILALPFHPYLEDHEVQYIAAKLREALR